jgi:hypothetical protein
LMITGFTCDHKLDAKNIGGNLQAS